MVSGKLKRNSKHIAAWLIAGFSLLLLLTACPTGTGPGSDEDDFPAELTATEAPVVTPLGPVVTTGYHTGGEEIVVYAYAVHSRLEGTTENYAGLRIEWLSRVGLERDLSATYPLPGGGTAVANVTELLDLAYDGTEATDTILPLPGFDTNSQPHTSLIAVNGDDWDGDEIFADVVPATAIIGFPPGEEVRISLAEWQPGAFASDMVSSLSDGVTITAPEYDGAGYVSGEGNSTGTIRRFQQRYLGTLEYEGQYSDLQRGIPTIVGMAESESDLPFTADTYIYVDDAGQVLRAGNRITFPATATSGYLVYHDTEVGVRRVTRVDFAEADASFDSESSAVETWLGSDGDLLTIDSAGRAVSVFPDGSRTYATQLDASMSSVVFGSPLTLTSALSYGSFSYGEYAATSLSVDGDILTSEYPLSDTYVRAQEVAASASGTARTISSGAEGSAAAGSGGGAAQVFRLLPASLGLSGLSGIDVVVDSLTDEEIDATIDEESGEISVTGTRVGDTLTFDATMTDEDGTVSDLPPTTVVIDEADEAIGSVFVTDEDYLFKINVRFSQPLSSNPGGGVYWFEDLSHTARLVVQNNGSRDAPAATVELSGSNVSVTPTTLTLSSIPAGEVRSFDIEIEYTGPAIAAGNTADATISVVTSDSVVGDWEDSARLRFYATEDRRYLSIRASQAASPSIVQLQTTLVDATGRTVSLDASRAWKSLEIPVSAMPIDVVVADAGLERRYDLWYTSSALSSNFWGTPSPVWNDSGRVVSEGNTDASRATATSLTLDAGNEHRAYVQDGDVDYYSISE